jgi:hypothetical protein
MDFYLQVQNITRLVQRWNLNHRVQRIFNIIYFNLFRSWGSLVSIVSDYRLVDGGSILGRGKGFFLKLLYPGQL